MIEPRSILVAGAVGRLGEAVLNQCLALGRHERVIALADSRMSLGIRSLSLAPLGDLPPADDAILVLADPDEPSARSFYGRDAAFTTVTHETLPRVAQSIARTGVRRVVLVSPLPAWQQMSRFHGGLSGDAEQTLAGLPFETVLILRPVKTSSRPGVGLVEKIANAYLSVQMLMIPRSIPSLTSDQLARATLQLLVDAGPGVQVFGAEAIAAQLALARKAA